MNIQQLDGFLIEDYIDKNLLVQRKHPTEDLWILNYTDDTQYEKNWDDITTVCRGLIVDSNYKIKFRSYSKFFNYEELIAYNISIPDVKYHIQKKMDGMLGIGYFVDGKMYIASRGYFDSEYALAATKILHEKYGHFCHGLPQHLTFCFEIILGKDNKIIIDYDFKDIILTGVIDTETGKEVNFTNHGFNVVETYDMDCDFEYLKSLDIEGEEGFVLKSSELTFKIKFENYIHLHGFIGNYTLKKLIKSIQHDVPLSTVIKSIPDEFYDEMRNNHKQIQMTLGLFYLYLEQQKIQLKAFDKLCPDRRTFYQIVFKHIKFPTIVLAHYDGKIVLNKIVQLMLDELKF